MGAPKYSPQKDFLPMEECIKRQLLIPPVVKALDIIRKIEELAPLDRQAEWDNSGVQFGNTQKEIKKVAVALDSNQDIIKKASDLGADMLITHHPLLINEIKTFVEDIYHKIKLLSKKDIVLYSPHTSFDRSPVGTAIALGELLGLSNLKVADSETGVGAIGECNFTLPELIDLVKEKLKIKELKYIGELDKKVRKVGVVTGAGFSTKYIDLIKGLGVDLIVSGDLNHHSAEYIVSSGLMAIDATHVATEMPGIKKLCEVLKREFPEVEFYIIDQTEEYWKTC